MCLNDRSYVMVLSVSLLLYSKIDFSNHDGPEQCYIMHVYTF